MPLPFFRTRKIRCPDGTTRIIYKSIDEACPLYITEWKADVAGSLKIPGSASAEAKAQYEKMLGGMLFALDEQNNSLMMNFRAVYLCYASNPCGNDGYFQRKIDDLIDQQHQISTLKLKIATLIQLIASTPSDVPAISHLLGEIASRITGSTPADAASIEIAQTREVAKQLLTGDGE